MFNQSNGPNKGGVVTHSSRLIDRYPAAYKDFFGTPSGAPCIYKSGPTWPEPKSFGAQRYIRETRHVYGHPMANDWLKIGTKIYQALDSLGVKWTSIDPVAFANKGEKTPFCPLLVWIGVKRQTLTFEAAVTAADTVKHILWQAGFPTIEVAFRESEVTHSLGGPKLLSFDPVRDHISEFSKAFTPTLGLAIAPLRTPYYEGTGALYFRLGRDDDHIALLTAAHVARPPPKFANTGMSRKGTSQPREEIVALGTKGYQNATNALIATVDNLTCSIAVWKKVIRKSGDPVDDENVADTARPLELQGEVEKATKMIDSLNKLHNKVAKLRANPDQRIIGCLLHAEPIAISYGPHGFTCDWALVQLYKEKIDWVTFRGNKPMTTHPEDQVDYEYPDDGLLQAFGVVKDDEIRQPKHLDKHGRRVLMVVKNGLTTGTTVGRANGLYSFTRVVSEYGIMGTSVEVAILPYNKKRGVFSAEGDSGSIILDRSGRIIAMLTSGSGGTAETDITYGTPYWWLEEQVKNAFPSCFLYEVVG
ncbi:hypothetical protein HOY82DRAFT_584602 [Tuber indicum]|nr:hypothetical protein HOY82DRAFT_584602 [Tuber indicum]